MRPRGDGLPQLLEDTFAQGMHAFACGHPFGPASRLGLLERGFSLSAGLADGSAQAGQVRALLLAIVAEDLALELPPLSPARGGAEERRRVHHRRRFLLCRFPSRGLYALMELAFAKSPSTRTAS